MEQNILDFSNQQDLFCKEFRTSLEDEVVKRNEDLTRLSSDLSQMLESQLKKVGKLSLLATEQLYAEQKWMTGYLKSVRNEADKQTTKLQAFLTKGILPWLQELDSSLREQGTSLDLLQQKINTELQMMTGHRNLFLTSMRKTIITANNKVKALSQLQRTELQSIGEQEEKAKQSESEFGAKFKEAKRKIDGLLSSLLSEYESYSAIVNKTSNVKTSNIASTISRNDQIASIVNIATENTLTNGKDFQTKVDREERSLQGEMFNKVEESVGKNKDVKKVVDKVKLEAERFTGERQGSWELHYSNQEMEMRRKADVNKDILQKHQSEAQVYFVGHRQEMCHLLLKGSGHGHKTFNMLSGILIYDEKCL